ncbi:MAG: uridine kinase [Chloroflexi bacterium]|nr:uridine kinase [Chloroflexota bacterium]
MSNRRQALERLAESILAQRTTRPLRVAIDGVDGAGKTFLADELIPLIAPSRPVIRASIDRFHYPREYRYRQGIDSPAGYYQDSFDNQALVDCLLQPLGPEGNRIYQTCKFDFRENAALVEPSRTAPVNAVLLCDGVFLLRPELVVYWDFRIFVEVDFQVSVPRAVQRDLRNGADESETALLKRYQTRYVPGQQRYFQQAQPRQHADVIWDNTNFENPLCTYY